MIYKESVLDFVQLVYRFYIIPSDIWFYQLDSSGSKVGFDNNIAFSLISDSLMASIRSDLLLFTTGRNQIMIDGLTSVF